MIAKVRKNDMQKYNRCTIQIFKAMTPQTRKVIIIAAVSIAVLASSFLIPAVIFPAYKTTEKSANCFNFNCAGNTYQRCETNQASNSTGFIDMLSNGMKGLMCMTGINQFDLYVYHVSKHTQIGTFKSEEDQDH
jgi:hypothetical protein